MKQLIVYNLALHLLVCFMSLGVIWFTSLWFVGLGLTLGGTTFLFFKKVCPRTQGTSSMMFWVAYLYIVCVTVTMFDLSVLGNWVVLKQLPIYYALYLLALFSSSIFFVGVAQYEQQQKLIKTPV